MIINIILIICIFCILKILAIDSPIIGIITHPVHDDDLNSTYSTKIEASYVKWIESAGGRVIPIDYNMNNYTELDHIFSSINGLLFPGGGTSISKTATYLYNKVIDANQNDDYFPLWGTCLGFQWLSILISNNQDIITSLEIENRSLSLNLTANAIHSYLYQDSHIRDIVTNEAITMNNHHYGLSPLNFNKYIKPNGFQLLSTNIAINHQLFVSSYEHIKYPIYAVQYHPEKNQYEHGYKANHPYEHINHSMSAIQFGQYTANIFINAARKNTHYFHNKTKEDQYLIYNYPTFRYESPEFIQTYYFK